MASSARVRVYRVAFVSACAAACAGAAAAVVALLLAISRSSASTCSSSGSSSIYDWCYCSCGAAVGACLVVLAGATHCTLHAALRPYDSNILHRVPPPHPYGNTALSLVALQACYCC